MGGRYKSVREVSGKCFTLLDICHEPRALSHEPLATMPVHECGYAAQCQTGEAQWCQPRDLVQFFLARRHNIEILRRHGVDLKRWQKINLVTWYKDALARLHDVNPLRQHDVDLDRRHNVNLIGGIRQPNPVVTQGST